MAMPMSEVTENLVLAGEGKTKRPQSQMVVLGIMAGALIAAGAMASSVAMHAISNDRERFWPVISPFSPLWSEVLNTVLPICIIFRQGFLRRRTPISWKLR